MKAVYDAVIVGGGPAGMFLAARLGALRERGIVLLEKGPRLGRKLLASGSGQCNLTHAGKVADFLGRYGSKGRFLKPALYGFSNDDLVLWFEDRGLRFETEEGGKVFPATRRAKDVLDLLLEECRARGIEVRTASRVVAVRSHGDGFEIETADGEGGTRTLIARAIAITAGGRSYPATGSEGEGYGLAASLGHVIVEPRPALSPVYVNDRKLCELAGLTFEELPFTIRKPGGTSSKRRGDVLITHDGLSGPGILDASRDIEPGDTLELDFGRLGGEAFREAFMSVLRASPSALVRTALAESGLPRRLADLLCAQAGLASEARCATLKREARELLLGGATAYAAKVAGLGGFDKAMATAGGVSTDQVRPATMESRLVPGLFFAGEVLDYDGDTGGFNLQAAFSTAEAAAKGMAASLAGEGGS